MKLGILNVIKKNEIFFVYIFICIYLLKHLFLILDFWERIIFFFYKVNFARKFFCYNTDVFKTK